MVAMTSRSIVCDLAIKIMHCLESIDNTVDGSEIPSHHRLDGAKTLGIIRGFQLPFPPSTGELIPDFL